MNKEECCSVFVVTVIISIIVGAILALLLDIFIPDNFGIINYLADVSTKHGSTIAGLLGILGVLLLVRNQNKSTKSTVDATLRAINIESTEIEKRHNKESLLQINLLTREFIYVNKDFLKYQSDTELNLKAIQEYAFQINQHLIKLEFLMDIKPESLETSIINFMKKFNWLNEVYLSCKDNKPPILEEKNSHIVAIHQGYYHFRKKKEENINKLKKEALSDLLDMKKIAEQLNIDIKKYKIDNMIKLMGMPVTFNTHTLWRYNQQKSQEFYSKISPNIATSLDKFFINNPLKIKLQYPNHHMEKALERILDIIQLLKDRIDSTTYQ